MLTIYLSVLDTQEEKDSFEKLYDKYHGSMYTIAYSILHNQHDAEDALSDAFLCIANKFSEISKFSCQELRGYCVIIVRNTAINIYRKNRKFSDNCEQYEEYTASENVDFLRHIEINDLREAMKTLTDTLKDVIYLYYGRKKSAKDIAYILDISESTVWKRLERARTALKLTLEKGGNNGQK